MALVWMDGFDHYGPGYSGLENMKRGVWEEARGIFNSLIKKSGSYSFEIGSFPSNYYKIIRNYNSEQPDIGIGFSFYTAGLPASDNKILTFLNADDVQTCALVLTSTGYLKIVSLDTNTEQAITPVTVIKPATWHHIELFLHSDTVDSSVELRVDQAVVLEADPITVGVGAGIGSDILSKVKWSSTDHTNNIYLDNVFSWDISGDVNNTFIGDKQVLLMPLIGAENPDTWLPYGTDKTYEAINELPPDLDVSYMYAVDPTNPEATSIFRFTPINSNFAGNIYAYQNYTLARASSGTPTISSGLVGGTTAWIAGTEKVFKITEAGLGTEYNFRFDDVYVEEPVPGVGTTLTYKQAEFSWTCPADYNRCSIVAIGGGGGGNGWWGAGYAPENYPHWPWFPELTQSGGAGGNLVYANDLPLTPGETYTIRVGLGGDPFGNNSYVRLGYGVNPEYSDLVWGTKGGTSSVIRDYDGSVLISAHGGYGADENGPGLHDTSSYIGDGVGYGGNGGQGDIAQEAYYITWNGQGGGGGGGGGYDGNGGDGGSRLYHGSSLLEYATYINPQPGQNNSGAGGGGGANLATDDEGNGFGLASGGGGSYLYGQRLDGDAGVNGVYYLRQGSDGGTNELGLSTGQAGWQVANQLAASSDGTLVTLIYPSGGREYGGGGSGATGFAGTGANGVVRIIYYNVSWTIKPSFPSTYVGSTQNSSISTSLGPLTDTYTYYQSVYQTNPETGYQFTVKQFNDYRLIIKSQIAAESLDEARVTSSANLILTDFTTVVGESVLPRNYKNIIYPNTQNTTQLIKASN